MTVIGVDDARGLALCSDSEGERHTVETALVDPVAAGDLVLVHAGTAIAELAGQPESRVRQAGPAGAEVMS
jgi:hydrogenase maturation factor